MVVMTVDNDASGLAYLWGYFGSSQLVPTIVEAAPILRAFALFSPEL
jgi:hypothetical protein